MVKEFKQTFLLRRDTPHTSVHDVYVKGTSLEAQMVKNLPSADVFCNAEGTDTQVQSLGWEDPLEEETATHSSNLGQKITTDRRAWWATVHGVTKELDTTVTEQQKQHIRA